MKYDFEHVPDRRNSGATKWKRMLRIDPDVGEQIIPFSMADMEFLTPEPILKGMTEFVDHAVYGYTGPTQAYFDSVVGYMKRRHHWDIRKEWIITAPGIVPALYNLVKAFCGRGESVIIMQPVYYPFLSAVTDTGRRVCNVSLVEENGHYTMDFPALEQAAARPDTKMLILCSPHNPVGRVWTREELLRLADICMKNGVMIVSDEIHFDFIFSGHEHTVLATLSEEIAQKNIFCTAPSKTYNLGGVQVSNIIIPNETLRRVYLHRQQESGIFSLNLFAYKIGELAYTRCDAWYQELMEVLDTNRKLVKTYLQTHIPQIRVLPLEGTYLQWLDCRGLGLDCRELEQFMQKKAKLFFDEGYLFGPEGEGFERWNLACPTHYIQEGLERLRQAVEEEFSGRTV